MRQLFASIPHIVHKNGSTSPARSVGGPPAPLRGAHWRPAVGAGAGQAGWLLERPPAEFRSISEPLMVPQRNT